MHHRRVTDPVERVIQDFLEAHDIEYVMDGEKDPRCDRIDFYIPHLDTYIEVKQFHAARVVNQMALVKNIIVIQGLPAAHAFVSLLSKS